jgi:hypothetical protein
MCTTEYDEKISFTLYNYFTGLALYLTDDKNLHLHRMKSFKVFIILLFTSLGSVFAQEITISPDSLMKTRAIKMEFFSPLNGNLTLGYEQYIKNFTSIEARLGIIGLGRQDVISRREKGFFLKVGPKFKLKPDYAQKGTYGTHLLRGGYIRPEVAFGTFNIDHDPSENTLRGNQANFFSIMINYGKQYILGDIMTLDWNIGVGYGFSNEDDLGYYYGNVIGDGSYPIAVNSGFTLGVLLK